MKVYTKKGDDGSTGLIGGTRVTKDDVRIEAYGTVDELNSWIGLVRDQTALAEYKSELIAIQETLFTIGSHLAADPEKNQMQLPEINKSAITALENSIDIMEEKLEPMKNFILPGGNENVSQIHITRCVCRRAERRVISLSKKALIDPILIHYLNRLSDYLFVLSRRTNLTEKGEETPWKPRG
jgi:cob(I)alamin adenosyltransferase